VGAGLLGVLAIMVGALLIVPNTDGGRAFIVRQTAALTDGQVRLAGIHGTFPAALDLDRLELRDSQGLWLWAEHLSLRWSPSDLLTRHIEVDSLHAALLHVERAPVSDTKQKSGSSSAPHTDVRDLTIDTLELGKALAGDPASLTVKASAHIRSLQDVDVHLTARRIAGDGDYEVDGHFDPQSMNATLKLAEPANGPLAHLIKVPDAGAILVNARLNGPRTAEDLQVSVAAGPLVARASGRIDLQNNAADLNYSLTAPPMSPSAGLGWEKIELQGQLHGPFTKLSADGHLLIKALQVPGGARLAELDAQLKGDQGFVSLQAGIDGLQIPGPAPGLFAASRLTLEASVRLDDAQRPLQLTARHPLFTLDAKAVTAGHQSADLTLNLPDLKPFGPFAGAKLAGDAQMTAHLDYTQALSSLTASLSSHLDGGNAAWAGLVRGGVTQLQTAVEMTDDAFTIRKLQLTGSAVSLTLNATAARTGEQRVKASFDLAVPNLHRVSAALAGDLKVSGTVDGPRQQLSADTHLTTTVSVRGSPSGTVSAHVQAKGLPQAPQGILEASGEFDGAPLQVDVELQPVNNGGYHALIRRADWRSAHAEGDVTLGKSVTDARGSARIRVGQLGDFDRLAGSQLSGSVNGQLALSAQGGHPQAILDFEAKDVVAGGVTANARLHAEGPMNALNVKLDADSPAIAGKPARINAGAVLNLDAKEVQLASLQASYHDEDLRLLNPAKVQFAQDLTIQQLKLGIQDATVEVDGELSPALDVKAAVHHVDPKLINAFVPNLLASGTADAQATLGGTAAAPTGTVHFQALAIRAKGAGGLPATDLRADARLNGDTADVEAHLTSGSDSQLALSGKVPLAASGAANLKLVGKLDLALANPILEAGGRHITGTMAIDTTVTGQSADPQIAGTVRLINGTVRDYTQGVSLTDITGELTGGQGVLRIERLTARAAPGDISIQGTIGVLQPKTPVDLKVTAKNAQPIASNIVTANIDADIQIKGTAREQLDVDGKVHLNRANVSIPGGLPPEVAVLDVERDGAAPPPPATHPVVINLHLDVEAPNRILITGRGLDAEMGGELHIRGTAAEPIVDGGFELQRGFFSLANSKLTFTSGTVTFNGSGIQKKLDPSLDFTAQTQAAEITAIVRITGVADAPQIVLSSTPDMPSDEILSRLLFGEPAASLTALQLVETAAALSSLQGGGDGPSLNPLVRIQKALGLDRLSVGSAANTSSSTASTSQTGASVEAGRYVSNRVYVGVKEGTTGSSQVDVDVDLTKNLKLQAQLGNGTATAQGVTPENDPGSSLGLAYQIDY